MDKFNSFDAGATPFDEKNRLGLANSKITQVLRRRETVKTGNSSFIEFIHDEFPVLDEFLIFHEFLVANTISAIKIKNSLSSKKKKKRPIQFAT